MNKTANRKPVFGNSEGRVQYQSETDDIDLVKPKPRTYSE